MIKNDRFRMKIKCYSDDTLKKLYVLKILLQSEKLSQSVFDFFYVVITALLREISSAATGWPYIAPNKIKTSSSEKEVLKEFIKLSYEMLEDISIIRRKSSPKYADSIHRIFNSDSRNTENLLQNNS